MACTWKTGSTCNIIRDTVNDTGPEEVLEESTIYTAIKCKVLEVEARRGFSQDLAHETDNGKMTIRVGKATLIKKGDILELIDKDLGDQGRYRIYETDPKRNRGRLKAIYLYVKKYNG